MSSQPCRSIAVLVLSLAAAAPAWADPPQWAPAYGHREPHGGHGKHKKPRYEEGEEGETRRAGTWAGYDSRNADRYGADRYGIRRGVCERNRLGYTAGSASASAGSALGEAVSGAVGQQASPLLGAIAGAVVQQMLGQTVGLAMDDGDRFCLSQTLEYGSDQRPVNWSNPASHNRYRITPLRSYQAADGRWCREFSYRLTQSSGKAQGATKTACRLPDGSWQ